MQHRENRFLAALKTIDVVLKAEYTDAVCISDTALSKIYNLMITLIEKQFLSASIALNLSDMPT